METEKIKVFIKLIEHLLKSDLSSFSEDYKAGYKDAILDIKRYLIKNK